MPINQNNKKAECIILCFFFVDVVYRFFTNASKYASEGILKSPLGERETSPTFMPSGIHERLNCWVKNLFKKIFSHFTIVSLSNSPSNAFSASLAIFSGVQP